MVEDAKINVGGNAQLNLLSSEISPACLGETWGGIFLSGDTLLTKQIRIRKSFITGTDTAISVTDANDIFITGNTILGDGTGQAIYIKGTKDFDVSDNVISRFETGIETYRCLSAAKAALIQRNIISEVEDAMHFDSDDHGKLVIGCNTLSYSNYGILSTANVLADQGSATYGAGNEFISSSSQTYHMLNHNNNGMRYYYDPSMSVSAYMNVTENAATYDQDCYDYSFDTSSSFHRPIIYQPTAEDPGMQLRTIPNPNSGMVSLNFHLGRAESGEIMISDIYGKLVYKSGITKDQAELKLNLTELADGMYIVSLQNSKGEKRTEKMIISR
jgi:hypothetical protein